MRGRVYAVLGTTLGLVDCEAPPFTCERDSACRLGGLLGRCEAEGHCSYPDQSCPSGARFSDNASAALAGRCVEQMLDGSSGGSSTGCGDGDVADDEECDDGNREDADGCNSDCTVSGSTRWANADGEGEWVALALAGGTVYAVGNSGNAAQGEAIVAALQLDSGATAWPVRSTASAHGERRAEGVMRSGAGVWVVGREDGPIDARGWAELHDDSGVRESLVFDEPGDDGFVAALGEPIVVAARIDDGALLRPLAAATWEARRAGVDLRAAAGREDGGIAALLRGSDGVRLEWFGPGGLPLATWRVGDDDERVALARDGAGLLASPTQLARWVDGQRAWWVTLDDQNITALAVHRDGSVAVAGRAGDAPWVARVRVDGAFAWTRVLADAPSAALAAIVAIDDGGSIVGGADAASGTTWIARLRP